MLYVPFAFPGLHHIKVAFHTRLSGDISLDKDLGVTPAREEICANRRRLCTEHTLAGFSELVQVHGTHTIFEPNVQNPDAAPFLNKEGLSEEAQAKQDQNPSPQYPRADGMALSLAKTEGAGQSEQANSTGHALLIKTADCQPIMLAHKNGTHIAALHVGWRGNRRDFIGVAIREICAHYNLRPSDWLAVRGPSLGPAAAEFVNFKSEWTEAFRPWLNSSTQCMDLWNLTREQLLHAGLLARNIFSLDLCTAELNSLFFSYRKETVCGRQASLIWAESAI